MLLARCLHNVFVLGVFVLVLKCISAQTCPGGAVDHPRHGAHMHANLFCVCPKHERCFNSDARHHAAHADISCQEHKVDGGALFWYSFAKACGARCSCRGKSPAEEQQEEEFHKNYEVGHDEEAEEDPNEREVKANEAWQLSVSLVLLAGVAAWLNRGKLAGCSAGKGGGASSSSLRGGIAVRVMAACGSVCRVLSLLPQLIRDAGEPQKHQCNSAAATAASIGAAGGGGEVQHTELELAELNEWLLSSSDSEEGGAADHG